MSAQIIREQKRCCWCKKQKPVSDFSRNKKAADGLQSRCKPCQVEADNKNGRRASKNVTPEKRRAHRAVERALKSGVLMRPKECSLCRKPNSRIHAHHDDYSKRLSVRWLCATCHSLTHQEKTA